MNKLSTKLYGWMLCGIYRNSIGRWSFRCPVAAGYGRFYDGATDTFRKGWFVVLFVLRFNKIQRDAVPNAGNGRVYCGRVAL